MRTKELLKETVALLQKCNETEWAGIFSCILEKLGNSPQQSICREIIKLYRGSGSFNDLVLQNNSVILIAENEELDRLRDELYQTAVKYI